MRVSHLVLSHNAKKPAFPKTGFLFLSQPLAPLVCEDAHSREAGGRRPCKGNASGPAGRSNPARKMVVCVIRLLSAPAGVKCELRVGSFWITQISMRTHDRKSCQKRVRLNENFVSFLSEFLAKRFHFRPPGTLYSTARNLKSMIWIAIRF